MPIDRSKSNLKVKQRVKRKTKTAQITKQRKLEETELLSGANVIFSLDNGTTGSISCFIPEYNYIDFLETPSIECHDYTQEIQKMNRIDWQNLEKWFKKHIEFGKQVYKNKIKIIVILERPMVNPQRFKQSRICITSL